MDPNHHYELGLERNDANFAALTPLSLIQRAALVYPDHPALVYGETTRTWSEVYSRCRQLASALAPTGCRRGDTVAVLAPNVPAIYEASFGVSMAGAVLNTLNTRLDADIIAFSLDHGEAKVLITDRELSPIAKAAVDKCQTKPLVIDIDDPAAAGGECLGEMEYEAFVASGDPNFAEVMPEDEWDAISLNYTSGTTGNPKGVVYHHRGAYLNAMCNAVGWNLGNHPVYLWTYLCSTATDGASPGPWPPLAARVSASGRSALGESLTPLQTVALPTFAAPQSS